MQPYELLTNEQVEQVHETALQILTQIGVKFGYPPALAVLKKGGAKVDGERVFFPARFVEKQIKKAPSVFRLYARNPAKDVIIGGDHIAFTPGYGAPFVTDLDSGRRKGTLQDFVNFVKLTAASTNQDICSGTVIEPKLIRGLPDDELNERALASILQWQFKPGIRDGEPVPVIALFTVTFRIH